MADSAFVITLTYLTDLESVDALLEQHMAWLQKQYDRGIFLMSGRVEPRTGGVIIAHGVTREELRAVLAEDPFVMNEVAVHHALEFRPSMASPALRAAISHRLTPTM